MLAILTKAYMRVWKRVSTRSRKSGKVRQPALPVSTMVVTPLRKEKPSGRMLLSPAQALAQPGVAYMWVWISTSPGVI